MALKAASAAAARNTLRVGVIGAGVGGLTLAHSIRHALSRGARPDRDRVCVCVWERDESDAARSQGYYLGLTKESLATLGRVGADVPPLRALVTDATNAYSAFSMLDGASGSVLMAVQASGAFVDRTRLRSALAAEAPVEWGRKFLRYEELPDGSGVDVHFEGGQSERVDILIGGDGAHSRVRRQRAPGLMYNDLGFTTIAGVSRFSAADDYVRSHASKGLARWLGDDGHTVMMFTYRNPGGEDVMLWVLSYPGQRDEWEKAFAASHEDVHDEYAESAFGREALLKACVDKIVPRFPASLAKVVEGTRSNTLFGPRQIYSVDPGMVADLPRSHRPRVYLLGDAAHATTTHRGLGANTAILDAAECSDALLSADPIAAMRAWEKRMAARGARVAKGSVNSTRSIHATGETAKYTKLTLGVIGKILQYTPWGA